MLKIISLERLLCSAHFCNIYLPYKIKNVRTVRPTLLIDSVKVIYSQLSGFVITKALLALVVITHCALPQPILNLISFIFHISSDTRPNYSTNLQNILKYSSISLRLYIFFRLTTSSFCLHLKYSRW